MMRASAALATLLLAASTSWASEDPTVAGAYCPFPEPGQKPACLAPVADRYPGFLESADSGALDEAATAKIEADLASSSSDQDAYLALSSLAYAYFRLAQFEAADPGADPALVTRLERWNDIMSTVYHDAGADPHFRSAVYEAASDLHARAPDVCGEGSQGGDCNTTSGLMLTLQSADDFSERQGVRGALSRLLGRMLGRDASSDAP